MKGSRHIRLLLYDFAAGALPPDQLEMVRDHLAKCAECRKAHDELRAVVRNMPPDSDPASALPPAFWKELLNDVGAQLPARRKLRILPAWLRDWWEFISVPRHQWIVGVTATAMLVALLAGSWFILRPDHAPEQVVAASPSTHEATPPVVNTRLRQYLRKSKALLVGVNNMPLREGVPVDLSVEREISRDLLHEARYLKDLALDGRSAALISDLEKIQITLANSREREEIHGIQLIRGGIQEENLLFKIRIAETVFERIDDETQSSDR